MQATTHCSASTAQRLAQKRRDVGKFGACRLPSRFGGVLLITLVPVVCSAAVSAVLLTDFAYSFFSPQWWLLISYFGVLQEGTALALTNSDVTERRRTHESEPPNIVNFLWHSNRSCVVQSVPPIFVEASQATQDGDSSINEVTSAVDLTWPPHLHTSLRQTGFLYVNALSGSAPVGAQEFASIPEADANVSSWPRRIHFQYWAGTQRVRASSDQRPYQLLIDVTRQQKTPGNAGDFERSVVASDSLLFPKTGAPVRQLGSLVDEERTLSDLNNGPAIVCVILIAVVGAVSVTAGTGGGAIFVPLMQLLMRFNTFEATATSQCLMTGSSLAGLILNFIRRNPVVDMPLIDMDMPKRARNETQLTAAEHTQQTRGRLGMAVPVEDQQSAGEMGVTTRKAAGDEEKKQDGNETQKEQKTSGIRDDDVCENQEVLVSSEDEHVIHKEERDTQAAALDSDDRRRRKTEFETIKYLWERHELTKWSILLTIWTINLTITFIKGGKRSTVHVVPFCSVSYWIIYVVGCLFLATASLLWGYKLLKRHKKRLRLHQLCYSSIEFTPDNVQFLLAQAFFAGMLGAIVGIGGGLILGPALLLKGVVPSVSSSLTSCLVLLSASTAGTINLTSRMAPPSISGVLFLVLFFTTLVGKSLLDRLIRKHKLERLLVVLMASIMCCSIGCSIVAGTVDGIKGPKSRQEFKLPCDR